MWTNGVDDRWYTDAEITEHLWKEIDSNSPASDVFGQWVNEEFVTPWNAAVWCELAYIKGEDPMASLFHEWVCTLLETDRHAVTELFGFEEWGEKE